MSVILGTMGCRSVILGTIGCRSVILGTMGCMSVILGTMGCRRIIRGTITITIDEDASTTGIIRVTASDAWYSESGIRDLLMGYMPVASNAFFKRLSLNVESQVCFSSLGQVALLIVELGWLVRNSVHTLLYAVLKGLKTTLTNGYKA